MPSDQTKNYHLSQWEPDDKVQREDFNADNRKIDDAISKCGNCRIRTSTYVGDGKNTRTHTFEHKPLLMLIFGTTSCLVIAPGHDMITAIEPNFRPIDYAWTDHSVTLSGPYSSGTLYCNTEGRLYTVVAFEDAGAD